MKWNRITTAGMLLGASSGAAVSYFLVIVTGLETSTTLDIVIVCFISVTFVAAWIIDHKTPVTKPEQKTTTEKLEE